MTTLLQIGLKKVKGYTIVDDCDADIAGEKSIQMLHANADTHYAKINLQNGTQDKQLHRLIAERMIGRPLGAGEIVDHINGDPLDNRRCNLRVTTHRVNSQNKKINRQGHLVGTHFNKRSKKWTAHATLNGIYTYLGSFETAQQAHAAYLAVI